LFLFMVYDLLLVFENFKDERDSEKKQAFLE